MPVLDIAPLYLQAEDYTARDPRALLTAQMGDRAGIVYPGDFLVTQNATANMSVNVAAGRAFVAGTTNPTEQRLYFVETQGTINLPVAAPDATYARIDLVVLYVEDALYVGAASQGRLEVLTGTASATPAEPTPPPSALVLARLDVDPASTDSVMTSNDITDRRYTSTRGRATSLGGVIYTYSGLRPTTNLYVGLEIFELDTNRRFTYNGTSWVSSAAYTQLAPLYYDIPIQSLNNGGWTALTGVTNDNIMAAPFPLTMHVEVSGHLGFGGAPASGPTRAKIRLECMTGAFQVITKGSFGEADGPTYDIGSPYWTAFHAIGTRDFAIGETVGWRMAMSVTNGPNCYIGGAGKVVLTPKVS